MDSLTLADILTDTVVTVSPQQSVDAVMALMQEHRISAMVIASDEKPLGIFTERDAVMFAYNRQDLAAPIGEVMSGSLITAPVEMDYREAYQRLKERGIRHLVVVDSRGMLAGIVSEADFLDRLEHEYLADVKRVDAVMNQNVLSLAEHEALEHAVSIMADRRISCVVVERDSAPVGIVTERDLVRLARENRDMSQVALCDVMSHPVQTVLFDDALSRAMRLMDERRIRRMVVVNERGKICGLVTRHDIVNSLYQRHIDHLHEVIAQLREALSKQPDRLYHHFIEHSSDAVLIANACGGLITEVNGSAGRTTGYSRKALMEMHLADLFDLFDGPAWWDLLDRSRREDGVLIDTEQRCRDGGMMPVELSLSYVEGGPCDSLVAVVRDIGERVEAERALREQETRFRELFDNMSSGVAVFDVVNEGEGFVFCNHNWAGERITGRRRDEVIGKRVCDIFPGAEAMGMLDIMRRVYRSGKPEEHAAAHYRDADLDLWLQTYVYKLPSDEVVVVYDDVTRQKKTEIELARSEIQWAQAMDQFDDVLYLLDMERRLIRANKPFYGVIEQTPEQAVGRHIVELLHPHGDIEHCAVCKIQEAHQEGVVTLEADDPYNPTRRPIDVNIKLMRDEKGVTTGMLVGVHDLTRTREIEETLRQSATVFENTLEGVIIADPEARVLNVNPAFSRILGYSRDEVADQSCGMWKSGRHDRNFYRDMWRSIETDGQWRGELWNRRKNGEVFPCWMTISAVRDEHERLTHYVAVFSDISEIKRSQEQLRHLAHHDALTGLPNRLLLNARLEHALKHAERNQTMVAVIFLDLDRFKNINDSLGHPVGDGLLQKVSELLLNSVRNDDTVARIGGDEFVLLLEDLHDAGSVTVTAEKMLSIFRQPFRIGGRELHVSSSMGISLYPQDGTDVPTLMKNADAAMYRAKEEGRNNYQFYTRELTGQAFERMLLESHLRKALEREELCLHYQPQIDLRSGRVVGLEALVRWQHPEFGMVSPAKFIPLAEETGLIHAIGEWVLYTACDRAADWRERGVPYGRIAVNVSGRQIQRGDLVEQVKGALLSAGLPADRLELEVTESFIMQEAERAIGQLDALRTLGVMLAIDDFGTGYSSLSYLKRFPIDKLKIDQSFVRDIPNDANDMAISQAVIVLGRSLGLKVIAEGVENDEQVAFLVEAGCDEVQGYRYSKPLDAEDLEAFLLEHADR